MFERMSGSCVFCLWAMLISAQKALKDRGIDQMLDEARADNKENDAEYLKPSVRPRCKLLNIRLCFFVNLRQESRKRCLCLLHGAGVCMGYLEHLSEDLFALNIPDTSQTPIYFPLVIF